MDIKSLLVLKTPVKMEYENAILQDSFILLKGYGSKETWNNSLIMEMRIWKFQMK